MRMGKVLTGGSFHLSFQLVCMPMAREQAWNVGYIGLRYPKQRRAQKAVAPMKPRRTTSAPFLARAWRLGVAVEFDQIIAYDVTEPMIAERERSAGAKKNIAALEA